MSENNSSNSNYSESQPPNEIFSDATNRLLNESPQKVYSNSQPTELNLGILKKGRKSLINGGGGRRVSFAASAHVRLFKESNASDSESINGNGKNKKLQDEDDEEERGMEEFRKQFEIKVTNNNGNILNNTNNKFNNNNLDELKDSFSGFEINSSPVISQIQIQNLKHHQINIEQVSTPSKRPYNEVNQSFDVDLKTDEQPSFSSYLSPEKDMDLTGCVGNILDDLSSPMSANSRRTSQMEFTNCVGSILARIERERVDEEGTDSGNSLDDMEMEMTQSIGSLVIPLPTIKDQTSTTTNNTNNNTNANTNNTTNINNISSSLNLSVENSNSQSSDNMEMTQPIGSLILENDENYSNNNDNEHNNNNGSNQTVDVSFIGDCAEPAAFNFMNSMSPSKYTENSIPNTSSKESNGSQLARDVFTVEDNDLMNTEQADESLKSKLKLAEIREVSEAVDRESVKIAIEAATKANKEMSQVFSVNVSGSSALNHQNSIVSDAPTANLKEFLNETGVRFLDNLSNMGRRDTVGKPRDSTIITPARRMYIRNVMIPETVAIEKACAESIRTIEAQRQFLIEEEGKFNHHPPLAYREFLKHSTESPERTSILQKLKTLKSVARLFARQSWYEWRRGFENNFQDDLEGVLEGLKREYSVLEKKKSELHKASTEQIDPKLKDLQGQLGHLSARYESLSRSDWEQASHLHNLVQLERQKLVSLEEEMSQTLIQETSLRQNIEGLLEQRRHLQDRVSSLKHASAQFEDCTELALTELKSTFALQEALNGWRLVQLREDFLIWEYTRGTPLAPVKVRMNWSQKQRNNNHNHNNNSLMIESVLIESELSTLPTLKPASHMVTPEFINLPDSLASILVQLDNLVELSRELSLIKVQCDVQILPVLPGGQLPLLLTFFNFESKIKFDVIIGVSGIVSGENSKFKLLSFSNHYGPVRIEHVQSSFDLDVFSLRRIVNSISNLLK